MLSCFFLIKWNLISCFIRNIYQKKKKKKDCLLNF